MDLYFSPLFSGSSGNSVYVGGGGQHLLIDAGVSCARITTELREIGVAPQDVGGILVTHEHIDHTRGISVFARKFGAPIYATAGTWDGMSRILGEIPGELIRVIDSDSDFQIGSLSVRPFATPHDAAEPVGYVVEAPGGAKFALATDIGCMRKGWLEAVKAADAVLLESNYDNDMLIEGPYPYHLKKRIQSTRGHLSNEDSAQAALEIVAAGARRIILGHLSESNNKPDVALRCHLAAIETAAASDCNITVARRGGNSGVFAIRTRN